MIRGTTPTHIFQIPFDTGLLKKIRIFYAQNSNVVVEKSTCDCVLEGDKIIVTLTEEETLRFSHKILVKVQLKVLTTEGVVMATDIDRVDVGEILSEEVLSNADES